MIVQTNNFSSPTVCNFISRKDAMQPVEDMATVDDDDEAIVFKNTNYQGGYGGPGPYGSQPGGRHRHHHIFQSSRLATTTTTTRLVIIGDKRCRWSRQKSQQQKKANSGNSNKATVRRTGGTSQRGAR